MASGKINQNSWGDFLSSLSGSSSGSSSTSQRPDFFQSLYNMGAFDTSQNVSPSSTSAFTSTSQSPDFFQSLYDQGYVTASPSNSTETVLNPAGDYGFSVGSIGSNANLTDAIPTVTTPGFSIGNMDPNLPGIGIGTNMIPIFNDVMTTTLDNTGFRINPDSALGSTLNFDALNNLNVRPFQDDSNIEQITVTGQRPNQGNTFNLPSLTALDTTLDLGGGDDGEQRQPDGEQRQPDENTSPIEEIIVKGVRNAANTLIPGFSLFTGAYDFFKDLPEGDFTPEELEKLEKANDAANLYVDPQPTFLLDSGAGTGETTTTPGGVNVPGLGIGSLGGSRGFVGTQDVLVPATGQMGSIYSIRPGDTRGRFAAPAYVNPYADVAAVDTPLRPGFVSAAPIAAAPRTAVTPTVTQPTVTQPTVTQPTVTQPTVTQPTVTQPTVTQPTVTQPTVTQPTVTQPTVITDPPDVMTPQSILDSINAEDGFSRDEQKQIADLLSSGEIGIGNVTKQFGVESGDVIEGLLRGGFQTPEQLTEMIRGYGNEGFEEKDLIADLLNQGRTTPEEVAGYYSANRPEFADLTPEAVTGYLNEINMGRLQNLSDVEVGKLIDSGEMTPGQAAEIYQSRYPGLTEADVMASLNQMKSQGMFAMGGVVEKADGIESLLDKRQQAVNRMLSRRAVAQFRNGGPVVKKPLAPANFAGGGIATKLIQKGAEMLGFDDARQIEITREAVDLTNQMVDAGLVDPKFRVKLRLPEEGATRQNTGIEGDEEVFNAVNHALFSYHAGKSPLARAGSQAKEIYQGMRLGLAGKDPGSESLDYFNNMFGFDLARQGLSPEEAKSAIIDNIANIDNKGALSRLRAGEPLIAGKDLSRTAEDIRGSGPDVSAFDVLAGVQGFQDGGEALDPSDPLYIQEDYRPEVLSDMVRRDVKFDASKYPAEEENALDSVMQRIKDMGQGFADIPEFVGNYLVRPDERGMPSLVSPSEVGQDIMDIGSGMATGIQEDPTGFMIDMIPGISNIRSFMDSNALYEQATELDKAGDQVGAAKARSLASFSMTDVFNPIPGSRTAIKGIIAGRNARRAPEKLSDSRLDVLEEKPDLGIPTVEARERYADQIVSGDNPLEQEVFRETGAFIGADGTRKFEIDTSSARVDLEKIKDLYMFSSTKRLPEVLDFPELYENYPQLQDTRIVFDSSIPGEAQYRGRANEIAINPNPENLTQETITSTILHEAQHGVQNIEGVLSRELFLEDDITFDEYFRLPTEVEARNVQARFERPRYKEVLPEVSAEYTLEEMSDVDALRARVNEKAFKELMGQNPLDDFPSFSRTKPSSSDMVDEVMRRMRQNMINRENVPRGTSLPESRRVDPFESEADTRYRQKNPKR
jgi:hypothetical protein